MSSPKDVPDISIRHMKYREDAGVKVEDCKGIENGQCSSDDMSVHSKSANSNMFSSEQVSFFVSACSNTVTGEKTTSGMSEKTQRRGAVDLTKLISQQRTKLKTEQARFMQTTQGLVKAQNKAEALGTEWAAQANIVQQCHTKVIEAELKLKSIDESKEEVENSVNDLCQSIDSSNKLIQSIKSAIQTLELKCSGFGSPTLQVTAIDKRIEPFLFKTEPARAIKGPNETSQIIVDTPQFDDGDIPKFVSIRSKSSNEKPTCYFFNIGSCSDGKQCPNSHECAQCTSIEHSYLDCPKKPHICSAFNSGSCTQTDCFRQHVCLLCHEEGHSHVDCTFQETLDKDAPQRNPDQFCISYNCSGVCNQEACSKLYYTYSKPQVRSHHCLYCLEKHSSLNCPHAIHMILTTNRTRIILQKNYYKSKPKSSLSAPNSLQGTPAPNNAASSTFFKTVPSKPHDPFGYKGKSENFKSDYDRVTQIRNAHFANAPPVDPLDQPFHSSELSRQQILDKQNEHNRGLYNTKSSFWGNKRDGHTSSTPSKRTQDFSPERHTKWNSTTPCTYWNNKGRCDYGSRCRYDHVRLLGQY